MRRLPLTDFEGARFAQDLQASFLGHLAARPVRAVSPVPWVFRTTGACLPLRSMTRAFQGQGFAHLDQGAGR